jgi:hypothetical protein
MFVDVQHTTTAAAVIVGSVCVWGGLKDYFRVICIDKRGRGLQPSGTSIKRATKVC